MPKMPKKTNSTLQKRGSEELSNYIESLKCDNNGLEEIQLNKQAIGDQGVAKLVKHLPGSGVEVLDLRDNGIGHKGAQAIAEVLPHTNVKRLILKWNNLGDKGVAALAQGLLGSKVTELNLGDNEIGYNGLVALCRALPDTWVSSVGLQNNNIGDSGARLLTLFLPQTTVKQILLWGGEIGDEGAQALLQMLPHSMIEVMALEGNTIAKTKRDQITKLLKINNNRQYASRHAAEKGHIVNLSRIFSVSDKVTDFHFVYDAEKSPRDICTDTKTLKFLGSIFNQLPIPKRRDWLSHANRDAQTALYLREPKFQSLLLAYSRKKNVSSRSVTPPVVVQTPQKASPENESSRSSSAPSRRSSHIFKLPHNLQHKSDLSPPEMIERWGNASYKVFGKAHACFHPISIRSIIKRLLDDQPDGSYLLRPSSQDKKYAVSFKGQGMVFHALLEPKKDGWMINGTMFETLDRYIRSKDHLFVNPVAHEGPTTLSVPAPKVQWIQEGLRLHKMSRHSEALECFTESLALGSENKIAWYGKGIELLQLAHYGEALACLDEALALDENYKNARKAKASALFYLGRFAEAVQYFDAILTADSGASFKSAWQRKGVSLFSQNPQDRAAHDCIDRAYKLDKNDPFTLQAKALLYGALGDLKKETHFFMLANKAVGDEQNTLLLARYWYERGVMLQALQKNAEASAAFTQALSEYSNFSPAEQALADLRESPADDQMAPAVKAQPADDAKLSVQPNFPPSETSTAELLDGIRKVQRSMLSQEAQVPVAADSQVGVTYTPQQTSQLERECQSLQNELAALRREMEQSNSNIEQDARLAELESRLERTESRQAELWQRHQREQARAAAIAAFQNNPQLALYYLTLQLKLEEMILGCKAVASDLLQPQGGRLKQQLDKAQAGIDASKAGVNMAANLLGGGFSVLGMAFDFIPGASLAMNGLKKGIGMISDKRALNQARFMAERLTLATLLQAGEMLARELTLLYAEQLMRLPLPESTIGSPGSLFSRSKKRISAALLNSYERSPIQRVAEVAALRVLESLQQQADDSDDVPPLEPAQWVTRWRQVVINTPRADQQATGLMQRLLKFVKQSHMLVSTLDEKNWDIFSIYQATAIFANGRTYAQQAGDVLLYGFRQGTVAEAQQLGMSLQRQSAPVAPSSPAQHRFLKDLQKRTDQLEQRQSLGEVTAAVAGIKTKLSSIIQKEPLIKQHGLMLRQEGCDLCFSAPDNGADTLSLKRFGMALYRLKHWDITECKLTDGVLQIQTAVELEAEELVDQLKACGCELHQGVGASVGLSRGN